MSKSEKSPPAKELVMKAVVLCDDFSFAAKATSSLRRVGDHAGVRVRWALQCWPVNALTQAAMAEKILAEAADAHLVVIPARHAHAVPPWLRDWIEQWGVTRQIQTAAVAVIDEGHHATGFANAASPFLESLVRKHGLSLIADEGAAGGGMSHLFAHSLREVEPPLIPPTFTTNMARGSFRGLGINE